MSRTFRDAYNDRLPDKGLIFHSDRGANYTSESFRKLLVLKGVCQSFSKPGVPYDNAVMENFFGTLKKEEMYRRKYRSERELKECVAAFIIRYNNDRRHEKLNYRTPNQVEAEYYSNSNDEQV